jgi:hypothetical protein
VTERQRPIDVETETDGQRQRDRMDKQRNKGTERERQRNIQAHYKTIKKVFKYFSQSYSLWLQKGLSNKKKFFENRY